MLRLAVITTIAATLLAAFQQNGDAQASAVIQGDVNCSGAATTDDALQVIRSVAGLSASTECAPATGDVNCDDAIDATDSVRILRYVHDNLDTLEGCTPAGLAVRLSAAPNAAAAESLLIAHVYPLLDVGLYTTDGVQILAGAETDVDTDFYLYDFESALMAASVVGSQMYGIETLTVFLNEAGLEGDGDPLTDADVLTLLATNVSASRADETMFAWRLVDELALARDLPLDLTEPDLELTAVRLDSVQVFLVLYDLASALFAADVQAAAPGANITDLPTRALHDWAALNVHVSAELVGGPTQLRPTAADTTYTRTFKATVSFPRDEDLTVLSGPLAGYDPGEFISGVEGFPAWWYPEATLVPANGVMVERATSLYTSELGESRIDFLPNVECPNARGALVPVTHTMVVKIQPLIKSIFPPHGTIGLVSVTEQTEIVVSRRSSAAPLTEESASPQAFTSPDELPCEWSATVNGTTDFHHSGYEETGTIGGTVQFRLTDINTQFEVATYEILPGTVTWSAEGSWNGGCAFDKGGTDPIAGGGLSVYFGAGNWEYAGSVTRSGDRAIGCSGDGTPIIDTVNAFIGNCGSGSTGGPWIAAGTDLTGSCHHDSDAHTYDFNWHLSGISCSALGPVTPQGGGTCELAEAAR